MTKNDPELERDLYMALGQHQWQLIVPGHVYGCPVCGLATFSGQDWSGGMSHSVVNADMLGTDAVGACCRATDDEIRERWGTNTQYIEGMMRLRHGK